MAIDWASSDDEEFPDLDVVMARVKASKASKAEAVPSRRPPRSRAMASSRRSPSPECSGKSSGEDEGVARGQPKSTAVVRRRKLGPRTDNSLLKPTEEGVGKGLDVEVSKAKKQPSVNIRQIRPRKKRPSTPEEEDGNIHSHDDSQDDRLSDFIVYTDDDSDLSSTPPPQSRASRPKRETRRGSDKSTQEAQEIIPQNGALKHPIKKTKRIVLNRAFSRELTAPIDDAVTDSLARLDIAASQPERMETPPLTPPKPISQTKTLVSPQKLPGVPKTPHRPSMDLFWDQEFFNEWNEEHSPRKLFLPKVDKSPAKSPAKDQEEKAKIISDKGARKLFEARKHKLAESFLHELDNTITDGQIHDLAASTGGVKINWSKTLNTTAGRANWKRETIRTKGDPPETRKQHHHASIELAEKVISDENRLLNVLAHEFCHLANFMITGMTTNPHGKEFKAWASKVSRAFADRDIEVTTKHSYEIDFKYVWTCGACGLEYKRHSKSINPDRHRCGACKGSLEQSRPVPRGTKAAGVASRGVASAQGVEAKKKEPTEYQRFVKEQMRIVREENPGSPQKDMMRLVAEKWTRTRGVKKGDRSREASVESVANQLDNLVL